MFSKILSAAAVTIASFCANANASNLSEMFCDGNMSLNPKQIVSKANRAEISDIIINKGSINLSAVAGSEVKIPLYITDIEGKAFKTLDITVEINGEKQNVTITPEDINNGNVCNVVVNAPDITGEMPLNITIDKIDGIANNGIYSGTEGKIKVLSRKVDHKVVVEEFTGFWCGWCPKGIVAMEKAKQVYGDKVIIVTVHQKDALACKDYETLANQTVANYPQAHVDRTIMSVDPYYGSSLYKVFGIGLDIEARAAIDPVAEVIAEGTIDGDVMTAKADVKFLYTGAAHHALAFVLTENNMKNENWLQNNFLTQWKGQPIEELEPMFDKWINGEAKMKDIVFDDVAMVAKGIEGGIAGSIPSYVTEEESNTYEVEFDLRSIKKIMDYDELNLCVFLFDTTTGHVENADSKSFNPFASIDGITEDTEKVETARYTIDGKRINAPQKGLNIIKYSDGSAKKVMIK